MEKEGRRCIYEKRGCERIERKVAKKEDSQQEFFPAGGGDPRRDSRGAGCSLEQLPFEFKGLRVSESPERE